MHKVTIEDQISTKEKLNELFLFGSVILFCIFMIFLIIDIHKINSEAILFHILLSICSISLLRLIFHVFGAIIYSSKNKKQTFDKNYTPPISIIIPAYNEGIVVSDILKNFEYVDYPIFEIIFVDDGSKDDTYSLALETAKYLNLDIKVFTKPNGGKNTALNFGIEKASHDFVFCMDADSILTTDSLKHGIKHFKNNHKLAAVAGVVKVENNSTFLGKLQYLDYLQGHFQRKALSLFKRVSIVPGPVGLFRKSSIEDVGYYEKENTTFAEDTELTLRLISNGFDIICEDNMIAYTEAPTEFTTLYRQRYRWTRGIYQALAKNATAFIKSDDSKNIILLMYIFWEQVIIPILDFTLLFIFVLYFMLNEVGNSYSMLFIYIFIIDLCFAIGATIREKNKISHYFNSFIARVTLTNILSVWKMIALFDEWNSEKMTWDKLHRTGLKNIIIGGQN